MRLSLSGMWALANYVFGLLDMDFLGLSRQVSKTGLCNWSSGYD
jgi:hypothetical protein